MNPGSGLLSAAAYYKEHRDLIEEIVDELVKEARANSFDDLAPEEAAPFHFSALVRGLSTDPDRAATVAAVALMRLARVES